jgi:hypothetical protein
MYLVHVPLVPISRRHGSVPSIPHTIIFQGFTYAVCKLHKGAEAAREKLHEGAELAKQGAKRSVSAFTVRCRKIRHKQDPPR